MVDPLAFATVALGAADKLSDWYEGAQTAAKTQQQKDAAALVYFAARLANAVAALDLEFRTLLNEINKRGPAWGKVRRDQLADMVRALATKELRLNQLKEATAFLRERARAGSDWRERILHLGGRDADLDKALDGLLGTGEQVLRMIGADREAPTPYEIEELERRIRTSDNQQEVEQTKAEAARVLAVIDRLTARSVPSAFGNFASVVSRKHGISVPNWASVR